MHQYNYSINYNYNINTITVLFVQLQNYLGFKSIEISVNCTKQQIEEVER